MYIDHLFALHQTTVDTAALSVQLCTSISTSHRASRWLPVHAGGKENQSASAATDFCSQKMLPGMKRGPKSKKWMKAVQGGFEAFFARRSEQLIDAQDDVTPLIEATGAGERWMFSEFDSEPTQVSISSGGTVRRVVAVVTGHRRVRHAWQRSDPRRGYM